MKLFASLALALLGYSFSATAQTNSTSELPHTSYHYATVDGLKIFYRESGPVGAPAIVLLHGFPSSSSMYRNLIPALADEYHVIAPDYPGFGQSDAPPANRFNYTFDHLAEVTDHLLDQLNLTRYSIYIQDYGAPVGFRLATLHPDRIQAIVSQNGNAYDEGLAPFWADYLYPYWKDRTKVNEAKVRQLLTLQTTKFQYSTGIRNLENISPDTWTLDQAGLDRPGNDAIQLALFYDYRLNPPLYPTWHKYLHQHQVPLLAIWGKNDPIFSAPGALAFKNDDPKAEVVLLDTGHFALEEDGPEIAKQMHRFLKASLK